MTKLKELTGKVAKFEDCYRDTLNKIISIRLRRTIDNLESIAKELTSYEVDATIILQDLIDLHKFYTQPFEPEMIEEYFKVKRIGISTFLLPNKKVFEVYRLDDEFVLNNIQGLELLVPTLSDFIDTCLNSNIELEWK